MVTKISDTVADFCWEGIFQHQDGTGPLNFHVTGGWVSDNVDWFFTEEVTLTLPINTTVTVALYYELGLIDLTVNQASLNYSVLYEVTTDGTDITNVVDKRTHYKERLLIPEVGGLIIDDYTKVMLNTMPATWLYPREDTITNGIVQCFGSSVNSAKLMPTLDNYELEAGPGAASLAAMRFKYGTGTGNPDTSCYYLPYRADEDNEKSSSSDTLERGGLHTFFYIDNATLTESYWLFSVRDGITPSNYNYIFVSAAGRISAVWRDNDSAANFTTATADGVISPQTWHSVSLEKANDTSDMEIYVDGVLATDAGNSSAPGSRDGWWKRVNSDGFDCINVPGQFYGWDAGNSDHTATLPGGSRSHDILIAGFSMWHNWSPSAANFAAIDTAGRGL